MPTSYTTLLGLALPVTGELSGTWGDVVSNYITQYVDSAVAGTQTISGSQTAVTLSVTNGSSLVTAGSGATGSAQFQIINCTGNPAGLLTITAPASSRQYIIINATSTSQSVKIVGVGPTTGVTILSGEKAHVAWNGSDFVKIATQNGNGDFVTVDTTNLEVTNIKAKDGTAAASIADSTGVVSITANPILSGGTANGVAYLNGSKVVTTGSALTFDGTNLGIGAASGGQRLFMYKAGAAVTVAFQSDANTNGQSIDFLNNAAGISGQIYYLPSSGYMSFSTAGSEGMRLTSTGLGIGTSSPGYAKLSVWGGVGIKDNEYLWWNTASTDVPLDYIVGSRASHYLKFGTNGSDRLTLDSSGNLGLGVTPSAWYAVNTKAFQIGASSSVNDYSASGNRQTTLANNAYLNASAAWTYSNTDPASRYHQTGGQHQFFTAPSGTVGNAITFTQAMTLDASGNLGLGVTSPATRLEVNGASEGEYFRAGGGTISARSLQFSSFTVSGLSGVGHQINVPNASGVLTFATGSTERARITSGGYSKFSNDGNYTSSTGSYHEFYQTAAASAVCYFRATNASYTGTVIEGSGDRTTTNASYYLIDVYNGNISGRFRVTDAGNCQNTNSSYGGTSDIKLKQDIVDAASQWDDIKSLRVRKYRFKDKPNEALQIGVIAQELEQISPGLVDESIDRDKDGNDLGTTTKSVKYSVLYMKAVKALQEAMARIEQLEAKVTALESKGA